ncbi:hypothetical protein T265_07073 [Opisthorchis viverrini]|uniref:Uncharacterized protein n=1 Tax=Opisthorchis viverrini TaxID=6198 RepID=A0A074ZEB1_OPIVI|nr:hypothetical protein T265_07073 [Opisthorchis viverrini]KER25508.1 hypothetical protein T265_07073 [Opisthorchis viverrini]
MSNEKARGSKPATASRFTPSRFGQPDSIPALVLPSGGMAARHRNGVTAERFDTEVTGSEGSHVQSIHFAVSITFIRFDSHTQTPAVLTDACKYFYGSKMTQRLERESTGRKVRGSNRTSAYPVSRLGQPGSVPAHVLPSGGRQLGTERWVTAEQKVSMSLLHL